MKTSEKITVNKTILKKQKNKEGTVAISVELCRTIKTTNDNGANRYDKKYKRISTGIRVLPANWSTKKQEVLGRDIDATVKNNTINSIFIKFQNYVNNLSDGNLRTLVEDEFPTIVGFFPRKERQERLTLIQYLDKYIELRKGINPEQGSWKEFVTVKNRLIQFQKYVGKTLYFEDIDYPFSDDLIVWMNKQMMPNGYVGYHQNTKKKTFVTLGTFLNHYYKQKEKLGIQLSDVFQKKDFHKLVLRESDPKPMSDKDYLKFLIPKKLTPSFERTRDRFLWQVATGLRHSDIHRIKKEMIINNSYIRIEPKKTRNTKKDNIVYINLNPLSIKILQKYNYDTAVFKISNFQYNRQLKELWKIYELEDKTYTTHNARDTFITNAVRSGVDLVTIMDWVGQSKFEVMRKYIKLNDEHKEKMMSKVELLGIPPHIDILQNYESGARFDPKSYYPEHGRWNYLDTGDFKLDDFDLPEDL